MEMIATTIINSTSVNPDLGERIGAVLSAEIGRRSRTALQAAPPWRAPLADSFLDRARGQPTRSEHDNQADHPARTPRRSECFPGPLVRGNHLRLRHRARRAI